MASTATDIILCDAILRVYGTTPQPATLHVAVLGFNTPQSHANAPGDAHPLAGRAGDALHLLGGDDAINAGDRAGDRVGDRVGDARPSAGGDGPVLGVVAAPVTGAVADGVLRGVAAS